jgi:hypothetical protein
VSEVLKIAGWSYNLPGWERHEPNGNDMQQVHIEELMKVPEVHTNMSNDKYLSYTVTINYIW